MEEDDSQDELINRSSSHNKGKRAAVWAISDDSDDVEEESGEGESDSDDEEEEDHVDGEDEDDDEEGNEDDEEEEEEDAKAEGAFAGTSADLAGMSSDEDADKCPICLNSFSSQPVATPETCEHYFCLDCILEWAKNANSCPVDRIPFNSIYLRKCFGGKVQKMITVQKPVKEGQEETIDLDLEQTSCEVCRGSDREDRLLLCDGCDAGYHMECLTPPLDAVPVEEWFCPECVANNRHSRDSGEDMFVESLPSTARATTSRAHSRAPGPTRAIARTQQSERVRANVNRHRITQARSSQLAPTYLIQSTWLDETINAVVAGLNTAVYVRDFTPRGPSRRRHKTGRRRKVRSKKTTKKATSTSTGVRRRKRKVRKTKSRKKLVLKKAATPRSRIASSLGMAKDKKGSSLPTVYRPSEHTLSSMRADIGAASLSIYGDPFDLDPFVDREEEEQQDHVTSLLEAKRRGISRSALRSHQPVARPVTASMPRRGMDVPQSGGVVEATPVPDLLGSILSGQSMLLMDSSDVVINRDGSLKAKQPASLSSGCGKSSSSRDSSAPLSPVIATSQGESSLSPLDSREQPGSSWSSGSRPGSRSASVEPLPRFTSHTSPIHHSDLPPRGHLSLQPPRTNRHGSSSGLQGASAFGARDSRETVSSSMHPASDSSSKNKAAELSQLCSKKAPTKPMWVDVSVLPRIPKIKRESSRGDGCESGSSSSSSSRRGSSSNSTSNGYGLPHTGMNSLAGDKNRQQSVEQQGRADSHAQRHRSDGAGSSSTFSNSFSSSSSAAASPAAQSCNSSSSSSSSAVSFRINSSGNSWHSRRLSIASSSSAGEGSTRDHHREKVDEAKKRQLRRDKQMLLASRNKEEDCNNIYDPFNPTLSESSGSDGESESLGSSSQNVRLVPTLGTKQSHVQSKKELLNVKTEKQEIEVSQKEPNRHSLQETLSKTVKVEKEPRLIDSKTENRAVPGIKIKTEPGLSDTGEDERTGQSVKLNSEKPNTSTPAHHSLERIKTEDEGRSVTMSNSDTAHAKSDSSASNKKKQKTEVISDSKSSSISPLRDSGHRKKTSKKDGTSRRHRSSSSESDRGRSDERHASGQGHKQREKDKDRERSSRRSRSRERRRRRMRSSSGSSRSKSPGGTHKKKCRSRSKSRSKERRQSRSGSSSGSRERSRKKQQQRNHERTNDRHKNWEKARGSKDKRHGRSRSKSTSRSRSRDRAHGRSRSKSRSRSRSRDRRKNHTRAPASTRDKVAPRSKDQRRHQSRSSSRERRKDEGSAQSSQKNTGSSLLSSRDKKDIKKEKQTSQSSLKEEKLAGVSSNDTPSSISTGKVKKEADSQAETKKVVKIVKEIKKEKQPSLDMFKDSPISIKKEDVDSPSLSTDKRVEKVEIKEEPIKIEICQKIKTETCEIATVKSEATTPEACQPASVASFSTLSTPAAADTPLETVSDLIPPAEQCLSTALTSVKQEVQQPSDSDDDFNVDVMLDSLDFVKSEPMEESGAAAATIKQEKDGVEAKKEGEQVSAILKDIKSKSQVKRVTWNIQEPDGPQPEKSASKLALYKLKLKQEGARRPSATAQTTSQDITGPGSVNDPSKEGDAGPLGAHPTADGVQPDALSSCGQGDTEEVDLLRKDKQYLKKLHMQERAIEEVKLAIKPFYQRRDINKDEYKEILRKAVQKVCHSKSGEINPVKVGNLVKAYVDKYKHARKHRKAEDSGKGKESQTEPTKPPEGP